MLTASSFFPCFSNTVASRSLTAFCETAPLLSFRSSLVERPGGVVLRVGLARLGQREACARRDLGVAALRQRLKLAQALRTIDRQEVGGGEVARQLAVGRAVVALHLLESLDGLLRALALVREGRA